jgi:membrane protein implicated in regulation of membrane protease activity
VTASIGEDITVAGVVLLAVYHPWWALGISAALLLTGMTVVVLLMRRIRRARRRRREQRENRSQSWSTRP